MSFNLNKTARLLACSRLARTVPLLLGVVMGLDSFNAQAQLQDHGPNDPTLNWPLWYRDNNGLALGSCKSTILSANGPMCLLAGVDPEGFPGNVGGEIFYMNLNANINNGAINLRYVSALEAAYGNATGTPVKGQEIVFARVRFTMDVNRAGCAGTYRIIHPWGDQTFFDVPVGNRALLSTIDIPLGAFLDFEGALTGQLGPFLQTADANEV